MEKKFIEVNSKIRDADNYAQQGSFALAASIYSGLIEHQPNNAFLYNKLGQVKAQAQKWEQAINNYQQALKLGIKPAFWTYKNLGDVLRELKRYDEAISNYQRAINLDSQQPDVYDSLGQVQSLQGDYAAAIASYQKAIDLGITNPFWTYQNLGDALNQLGRLDEAQAAYQQVQKVKAEVNENIEVPSPPKLSDKTEDNSWLEVHNQGDKHFIEKDWSRAIAYYQQAIELNPNYFWSHYNLGRSFSQLERWSDAISYYQSAIKIKPDSFDSYYWLGDASIKKGSWKDAVFFFDEAIKIDSSHGWTYFNLAFALTQENKLDEAKINYQNALQTASDDVDLSRMTYQALERLNEKENLIIVQKSIETNQNTEISEIVESWASCQQDADFLREQGELEKAIAKYYQAISFESEHFESYYWLGSLLLEKRKWHESEKIYLQAINLDSNHGWTYYSLGFTLVQQGKLNNAIAAYQKAIELSAEEADLKRMSQEAISNLKWWTEIQDSDPWKAPHMLADFLREKGNIEEAMLAYTHAIEINPNNFESHKWLGILHKDRQEWQKSELALKRAIELQPKNILVYRNLISVLLTQAKIDEVMLIYQQAIALDPDAPYVISLFDLITENIAEKDPSIAIYQYLQSTNNISAIHNAAGKFFWKQSQELLNYALKSCYRAIRIEPDNLENYYQALAIKPDDGELYFQLGTVLAKYNQLNNAIVAYQTSLQIQPRNEASLFQLGKVLESQKQFEKARKYYEQAIALNPTEQTYIDHLKKIDREIAMHSTPKFSVSSNSFLSLKPLPKISIVTPSYNQGEFLEECIDSVLSQGYPNLEYIVMDGGSTDDSVEIIKKYEKHLTHWQSKPDRGQYYAINDGFNRTTGEIMSWLNSDDKYHSNCFFKILTAFAKQENAEWITGKETRWDKQGECIHIDDKTPCWHRKMLLRKGQQEFIQQESTFWRRSLWKKAGAMIRTDISLAADFELWLRFSRYAQIFGLNLALGGFRYHGNQRSVMYAERYFQEVDRLVEEELALLRDGQYQNILPKVPSIKISDREVWQIKNMFVD